MPLNALLVRGPFRGVSGYDHHVRELVRALHRLGVAIELRDLPGWGPDKLPIAARDPWFERLDLPVRARVALHFCMPHQLRPYPGLRNVNYTMFEATHIPARWAVLAPGCDLVVVPTESSWRAWVESGVPADRVRISPLGVDTALFAARHSPLSLRDSQGNALGRYSARFLNVSALSERKNLISLLLSWIRATTPADSAALLIKVRAPHPSLLARLHAEVAELATQLGTGLEGAAPVLFLHEVLSDAEMPRLYASATHYISASHGEGWDQPMMEAAASGLSLIAPDHSAYRAYLSPSLARLIPSREVPCDVDASSSAHALFGGLRWWQPDEDAMVQAIRAAIADPSAYAGAARVPILTRWSWDSAAERLRAVLGHEGA